MKLIKKLILSLKDKKFQTEEERLRRRRENLICGIIFVVGIVVGILTWKSENYASTFFALFGVLMGAQIVAEMLSHSGIKSKRIKIFMIALLLLLLVNSAIANAELSDQKDASTKDKTDTEGYEEPETSPDYPKVIYLSFVWEDNLYMMNLEQYCDTVGGTEECMKQLIKDYTQQYVNGLSEWVAISDEELNGGDYGDYIHDANAYAEDYVNAKMKKVKIKALEEEINEREKAKKIYEKFDNLKLLGDAYVKMSENSEFSEAERIENLEESVKNYVKALTLAYYDEQASNEYISSIWNALSVAFSRISHMETTDLIHEENSKTLGEICAQGMSFVGGK